MIAQIWAPFEQRNSVNKQTIMEQNCFFFYQIICCQFEFTGNSDYFRIINNYIWCRVTANTVSHSAIRYSILAGSCSRLAVSVVVHFWVWRHLLQLVAFLRGLATRTQHARIQNVGRRDQQRQISSYSKVQPRLSWVLCFLYRQSWSTVGCQFTIKMQTESNPFTGITNRWVLFQRVHKRDRYLKKGQKSCIDCRFDSPQFSAYHSVVGADAGSSTCHPVVVL